MTMHADSNSRAQNQNSTRPSGIAQLRHASQHSVDAPTPDMMNLDDYLVPNSVASPAGLTPPASDKTSTSSNAQATAIPIKAQMEQQQNEGAVTLPPSSVPSRFTHESNKKGEFNYVQRRVRKTSVDERRVGQWTPVIPYLCYQD